MNEAYRQGIHIINLWKREALLKDTLNRTSLLLISQLKLVKSMVSASRTKTPGHIPPTKTPRQKAPKTKIPRTKTPQSKIFVFHFFKNFHGFSNAVVTSITSGRLVVLKKNSLGWHKHSQQTAPFFSTFCFTYM